MSGSLASERKDAVKNFAGRCDLVQADESVHLGQLAR